MTDLRPGDITRAILENEFTVVVGLKATGAYPGIGDVSVRYEYDIESGELAVSNTKSFGNWELLGGEASVDPDGGDIDFQPSGLKVDIFTHGNVGGLVGGTVKLDGSLGVRVGVGHSDGNIYIEAEGNVFKLAGAVIGDGYLLVETDAGYVDAGAYNDGLNSQHPGYWSDTGFIPAPSGAVNDDGSILGLDEFSDALNSGRLLVEDVLEMFSQTADENARGLLISSIQNSEKSCFLAGTEVSMSNGAKKPIEEVEVGDQVTSYDQHGNLVPGTVTRVFQNRVKHILDVFGLHVTPGHVTLCGDGPFAGRHVPMIDILRSDGALVRESGEKIRACTNEPVGSAKDQFIWAVTGEKQADGELKIRDRGRIRLGTRFITAEGYDVSVADLIASAGATVTADGLIQQGGGEGVPFYWSLTPMLPQPEDYVLQRSALQLNEIYQAAEWEAVQPQVPAPDWRSSAGWAM